MEDSTPNNFIGRFSPVLEKRLILAPGNDLLDETCDGWVANFIIVELTETLLK